MRKKQAKWLLKRYCLIFSGQHEQADPLPAAGSARQHPQLLREHDRVGSQTVSQKNSGRHFREGERSDLVHPGQLGDRGSKTCSGSAVSNSPI